jgi:ssDNA-specific exonuclease RecJ
MSLDQVSICLSMKIPKSKVSFSNTENFAFSSLQKFNKAAEDINALTATPTNDEFKEIYALFKQATVGDVNVG